MSYINFCMSSDLMVTLYVKCKGHLYICDTVGKVMGVIHYQNFYIWGIAHSQQSDR